MAGTSASGFLGYAATGDLTLDQPAVFTSRPFGRATTLGGTGRLTVDAVDPVMDAALAALNARYLCRFVVVGPKGQQLSTTPDLDCAAPIRPGLSTTQFALPSTVVPRGASLRVLLRKTSPASAAGRILFDGPDHSRTGLVLQVGALVPRG